MLVPIGLALAIRWIMLMRRSPLYRRWTVRAVLSLPFCDTGMLVVPAGSLDTDIAIAPDGNIFTASRAAWDHDLNMAPDYATAPEQAAPGSSFKLTPCGAA